MTNGWESKPLGELCDILDSMRKPVTKKDRVAGEIPYYGATGIQDYVADYLFDQPLVLVGEDGAKWESGENTAFAVSGKCWVNNHAHVLRPHRKTIVDNWLIYYLNATDLTEYVSGLTVPKLNQGNLRQIPIPVPPLPEQRRIVAILDEAFEGIATAKANAEKNCTNCDEVWSQQLTASFCSDGDRWVEMRIGDAGTVITGTTPSKRNTRLYGDAMPFVKPPELQGGEVDSASDGLSAKGIEAARTVPPRSVLVSCIGILGKVAITACRVAFNQQINAVVVDSAKLIPEFLFLQVMNPRFQSAMKDASSGTTVAIVNKSKFCDLSIVAPPVEQQQVIVSRLTILQDRLDRTRRNQERKMAALDELKASLLHQAFTGQL